MDPTGASRLRHLGHRLVNRVGSTAALTTALGTVAALGSTAARLVRPAGLGAAVVEAGWLAVSIALYPLGVVADQLRPDGPYGHYRTEALTPKQRGLVIADMQAAGTPILLVHGFGHNRSGFTVLARALRRRGFGVVYGVNFSVLTAVTGDVRSAARQLSAEVEQLCLRTGADRVHVVGHSLGGLIARYYVQRLGGDDRVHTLVTLGTPHGGTVAAYLLASSMTRELRPGSDVIAELAAPAPRCTTRFLAVWSELDELVIPQTNARLEHPDLVATNLRISDVGHLSLLANPRAVHAVATTLSQVSPRPSTAHAAEAVGQTCQGGGGAG